jgi:hypothetical protein
MLSGWVATKFLPHINIFHFDGKYINVGNASKNEMDGTKSKEFIHPTFIFTVYCGQKRN